MTWSTYGRGCCTVWDTVRPYWLLAVWAAFAVLVVLASRRALPNASTVDENASPRIGARLFMLALALPVLAYVVKIGGDPRHYRYLAFPVCLTLCAVRDWSSKCGFATACGRRALLLRRSGCCCCCVPPASTRGSSIATRSRVTLRA